MSEQTLQVTFDQFGSNMVARSGSNTYKVTMLNFELESGGNRQFVGLGKINVAGREKACWLYINITDPENIRGTVNFR